jgi:hypothetical protein
MPSLLSSRARICWSLSPAETEDEEEGGELMVFAALLTSRCSVTVRRMNPSKRPSVFATVACGCLVAKLELVFSARQARLSRLLLVGVTTNGQVVMYGVFLVAGSLENVVGRHVFGVCDSNTVL